MGKPPFMLYSGACSAPALKKYFCPSTWPSDWRWQVLAHAASVMGKIPACAVPEKNLIAQRVSSEKFVVFSICVMVLAPQAFRLEVSSPRE